ncbi:MAG: type II toxin-antitoxin system VapC family toxin [Acidobacteriaceae bacterium]
MSFLLDTNVVSEWVKPHPEIKVVEWLAEADEDRIFLSVITLAEIRHGIEQMTGGRRRSHLQSWLEEELPQRFAGRLVEVNAEIANAWGRMMALSTKAGTPLSAMDAFFAATANAMKCTLVTRNTKDFARLGIELLNPWIGI